MNYEIFLYYVVALFVLIPIIGCAARGWSDYLRMSQGLQDYAETLDDEGFLFKLLTCDFCHCGHAAFVLSMLVMLVGFPPLFVPILFFGSWKAADYIPGV